MKVRQKVEQVATGKQQASDQQAQPQNHICHTPCIEIQSGTALSIRDKTLTNIARRSGEGSGEVTDCIRYAVRWHTCQDTHNIHNTAAHSCHYHAAAGLCNLVTHQRQDTTTHAYHEGHKRLQCIPTKLLIWRQANHTLGTACTAASCLLLLLDTLSSTNAWPSIAHAGSPSYRAQAA